MKILKGKTREEALAFFDEFVKNENAPKNAAISEVYALAFDWKKKNAKPSEWGDFPIREVCRTVIMSHGKE